MENIEEKACLCALNKIFGFSPGIAISLLAHIGSAKGIFSLSSEELMLMLGRNSRFRGRFTGRIIDDAKEELFRCGKDGITFIGWTEKDYPELLRECPDAPVGLYVRSTTPPDKLWPTKRRIAVVGTRDISPYGKEWCMNIINAISSCKESPAIISGLALGTDFIAHKTALEAGLPTIAVMATGPDSVYPYRHRSFAEKLCSTPGCALITDYPPGTAPLAVHFLRRNRIIAGLSDSTLLIESKIKGGGMMTCRLAFSYDRDVFALPGRIDDIRSQGCNYLIKNKIAEPISDIEELIRNLSLNKSGNGQFNDLIEVISSAFSDVISGEKFSLLLEIVRLIKRERGITLDEIAAYTGSDYKTTAEITGLLETEGFISVDLLQRCSINTMKFRKFV